MEDECCICMNKRGVAAVIICLCFSPILMSSLCVCVCGSGCSGTSSSQDRLWEACAYVCVSFLCQNVAVPNPGKVFKGEIKSEMFLCSSVLSRHQQDHLQVKQHRDIRTEFEKYAEFRGEL